MNRRFVRFPLALASVAITVCVAPGFADPTPQRDDIQVRHVIDLERNTFRIAKDPRDNVLYAHASAASTPPSLARSSATAST